MAAFTGQLGSNEIFASLYNMIISQQVFTDNIIDNDNLKLVDKARVDGSMYGDTKLYYATDVLKSAPWGADAEATNLLKLYRPDDPETQAIKLNIFRQISLTVDYYLTKRAWQDEGAFISFNSVMLGWIRDTKKVYDFTTYNAFIGTVVGSAAINSKTITIDADGNSTGENIAKGLADLLDDMEDVSRDYNDYGFLRSYSRESIQIVWNNEYVNSIRKIDLPSIFHNDNLVEKLTENKINHRFFGTINASSGTTLSTNATVRSLVETDYEVASAAADPRAKLNPEDNKYYVHLFAGDLLPNSTDYLANTTYTVDTTIICKVFVKLPPFMSGFEVGTSFFNPKSLTENHYLTWGHNTLEYLKAFPVIKVVAATTPAGD
ncbi:MAG: hypothetical protein J6T10_01080 [Methanobrevibacter sp.]|nr:hypothetical protein [Methanobrevibacter sp.]